MENTFFPFLEFEGGFVVETLVYPKYFIHGIILFCHQLPLECNDASIFSPHVFVLSIFCREMRALETGTIFHFVSNWQHPNEKDIMF